MHKWHMNVLQLQPECSFLREICRKMQQGLLIFKAQVISPSQAGGCERHQGPRKFGRLHIHMHTHNFSLTSCQHIPSTEGRRRLHHLTERGRWYYQEAQQFPRMILHSEGDHHEKVFQPQSTLGAYTELLQGPYSLKSFIKDCIQRVFMLICFLPLSYQAFSTPLFLKKGIVEGWGFVLGTPGKTLSSSI